ncbi:MAG: HAD hydrolase-like protein, partial [Planctomycetaceae bacterium]|nr:HAD hydrolase-like protein [Planctomycetaceae bacterium]
FQTNLMVLSYQQGVRKPSKSLYKTFLQSCRENGVSPNEVLYIGSRLKTDVAVAKSLGMQTALYAGDKLSLQATREEIGNSQLRPDRLLTDLNQIGELLPQ